MPTPFEHLPHTRARGRAAEDAAADWLTARGYRILHRNVSTKAGEIDAIAVDGDTLCFVEIKARATREFGPAIEAVTRRKQSRLARSASLYLAANPWPGPARFDVLGLDATPNGWTYTLIQDAFGL